MVSHNAAEPITILWRGIAEVVSYGRLTNISELSYTDTVKEVSVRVTGR